MLEISKLREKNMSELKKLLLGEKENLVKLQMNIRRGTEKDTSSVRKTRKYIARILTVMKELEILKDAEKKTGR